MYSILSTVFIECPLCCCPGAKLRACLDEQVHRSAVLTGSTDATHTPLDVMMFMKGEVQGLYAEGGLHYVIVVYF